MAKKSIKAEWEELSKGITEPARRVRRLYIIRDFYTHDDIFKRQFDDIYKLAAAKEWKAEKRDKKIDELLDEAILRRTMLSFESMKKNYEARKREFEKIEKVLGPFIAKSRKKREKELEKKKKELRDVFQS